MTEPWAPYKPPVRAPRGWRVGPLQVDADLAAGDVAGLPADVLVDQSALMDLAVCTGDGLVGDVTIGTTVNINIGMLPAVGGDGDGLSSNVTVNQSILMDLADGSGGTALVPTLTIANPLGITGSTTSATTTVSLPTHNVGDIIVIFAARFDATAAVTKPAAGGTVPTWVDIDSNTGAGSTSSRSNYVIATANNHTSGTWTSAQSMIAVVLSGQNASPIGGHAEAFFGGSIIANGAPAVTMANTSGSSILLHHHSHPTVTSFGAAPAGYTRQVTGARAVLNTKDVTTSDGAVTQPLTASVSNSSRGATVEIIAS